MSHSSKTEILKQTLVFSCLEEVDLARLSELAIERSYNPGEFIFWDGDKPEWFFLVTAGRVKIAKYSSQGKEFIIAFFSPGEMFGEVAVFEDRPYPASAQAVGETKVLAIKKDDLLSFLASRPQVVLRIIGVLGERLREAQSRLRDLAGERVEQRLARTLLMLSDKMGPTLPFTRQEVADMVGITIETTIRVLSRLKEGGIIGSARGEITILDSTKLKLLAEGPPGI